MLRFSQESPQYFGKLIKEKKNHECHSSSGGHFSEEENEYLIDQVSLQQSSSKRQTETWSFVESKRLKLDESAEIAQVKRPRPEVGLRSTVSSYFEDKVPAKKVAKVTGVVQPIQSVKPMMFECPLFKEDGKLEFSFD